MVICFVFDSRPTDSTSRLAIRALRIDVADNVDKFDQTESESLVIGRDFGVATDIETGPNGNVFVFRFRVVQFTKSNPNRACCSRQH
jgi:hypothetical protein